MSLLAHIDGIVAVSVPVVDLSVGGIPNGVPRVADASAYDRWHGREIVTRMGGLTQLFKGITTRVEAVLPLLISLSALCGHIDGCVECICRESWT